MAKILTLLLTSLIGSLIARLLLGAGLSVVTYTFINDLVESAQNQVGQALYSLPAFALAFVSLSKIDQCLAVIMSAMGIAAFIKSAKVFIGKA